MAKALYKPGDMLQVKTIIEPHVLLVEQVRELTCCAGTQTEYYGRITVQTQTVVSRTGFGTSYWRLEWHGEVEIVGLAIWPPPSIKSQTDSDT